MKPSPAKVRDRMIGHLLKLDECHPSGKPILVANVRVWARAATLPSATATQKQSSGESRSRLSSGHSFMLTRQIAGPLTGMSRFTYAVEASASITSSSNPVSVCIFSGDRLTLA